MFNKAKFKLASIVLWVSFALIGAILSYIISKFYPVENVATINGNYSVKDSSFSLIASSQFSIEIKDTVKTTEFILDQNNQNINIKMYSNIFNNYVGFDILLVNETTKESYNLYESAEYYTGIDEEGSWSEGNQTVNAHISSLPPGKYFVQMQLDNSGKANNFQYEILISKNSEISINFILFLIAISLYPLYLCYYVYSDYSIGGLAIWIGILKEFKNFKLYIGLCIGLLIALGYLQITRRALFGDSKLTKEKQSQYRSSGSHGGGGHFFRSSRFHK